MDSALSARVHGPDEGLLETAGGRRLFRRGFRPPGLPRGLIVVVHGLAEHSGRYLEAAAFLAARGWAIEALDCRGHGRSGGTRVHVDGLDEYVDDVRAVLLAAGERTAGPRVLLGHSQGGLVALRFALTRPEEVSAVVALSPFLQAHPASAPGPVKRALVRVFLALAPRLPLPTGIDPAFVSRDPGVVARYRADPLVSSRASAGWLRAVRRGQRAVCADAGRLAVPALVLSAGADRLVDPEAARAFAEAAPPGLVEYAAWPGLFHELLNEPEREQVLLRIAAWLDARFPRDGD